MGMLSGKAGWNQNQPTSSLLGPRHRSASLLQSTQSAGAKHPQPAVWCRAQMLRLLPPLQLPEVREMPQAWQQDHVRGAPSHVQLRPRPPEPTPLRTMRPPHLRQEDITTHRQRHR